MEITKSEKLDENILDLLLQANPDREKVIDDYNKSEMYILKDGGVLKGVILLYEYSLREIEILNISINNEFQNQGLGKILLGEILSILKIKKYNRIFVGTGNSSISQLAFYQKLGFRMISIKKNYFIDNYSAPIFENGIQCKDLILLEKFIVNN